MTPQELLTTRLVNQHIVRSDFKKPEEVVSWMGAVQAQDYPGGLWAVGLRTPGSTIADVEKAITVGKIVRTWPMRGTLHFVAAEDVKWMLNLSGPKIISASTARWRYLELDEAIVERVRRIVVKALEGGKCLTRKEFYAVLEKQGITTGNSRGLHLIGRMALEGITCLGPHQGKQPTVVLFDEWIKKSKQFTREESLGEFAKRYFTSHGPATLADFAWWSGLKVSDARKGIELNGAALHTETMGEQTYYLTDAVSNIKIKSPDVHLLPAFDEYLVAHKDRSAAVDPMHTPKVFGAGNGIFSPVIVIDGRIEGTWGREVKKDSVVFKSRRFMSLSSAQEKGLALAVKRYGKFLRVRIS